jgi:hypothetical protein
MAIQYLLSMQTNTWSDMLKFEPSKFCPSPLFVYGRTITLTNGEKHFQPFHCPFCVMDTGGRHDYRCPNYSTSNIFIGELGSFKIVR